MAQVVAAATRQMTDGQGNMVAVPHCLLIPLATQCAASCRISSYLMQVEQLLFLLASQQACHWHDQ